jgi:energy-coupling factor transport system substrate-specific component
LLACLLAAVAVSLGFALSGVPNVELVTFAVFVSGYLLGPAPGAGVGAAAATALSVFNPLGTALPPLVAAQAAGQAVAGFCGGMAGPALARIPGGAPARIASAATGLALTVFYDVVTSVGAYATIAGEMSVEGLVKFVSAGIVFVGLHIVWNTVLFAAALGAVLRVLKRHREELNAG